MQRDLRFMLWDCSQNHTTLSLSICLSLWEKLQEEEIARPESCFSCAWGNHVGQYFYGNTIKWPHGCELNPCCWLPMNIS